eukprot:6190790-Pleurochrysis_carterae.AAC.2
MPSRASLCSTWRAYLGVLPLLTNSPEVSTYWHARTAGSTSAGNERKKLLMHRRQAIITQPYKAVRISALSPNEYFSCYLGASIQFASDRNGLRRSSIALDGEKGWAAARSATQLGGSL